MTVWVMLWPMERRGGRRGEGRGEGRREEGRWRGDKVRGGGGERRGIQWLDNRANASNLRTAIRVKNHRLTRKPGSIISNMELFNPA